MRGSPDACSPSASRLQLQLVARLVWTSPYVCWLTKEWYTQPPELLDAMSQHHAGLSRPLDCSCSMPGGKEPVEVTLELTAAWRCEKNKKILEDAFGAKACSWGRPPGFCQTVQGEWTG